MDFGNPFDVPAICFWQVWEGSGGFFLGREFVIEGVGIVFLICEGWSGVFCGFVGCFEATVPDEEEYADCDDE